MEITNSIELEDDAISSEELYDLSDMEDVVTNEDQDELPSLSSITPSDSISQVNSCLTSPLQLEYSRLHSLNDQKEQDFCLLVWVVCHQQPFTVVVNVHFRNFVYKLDPRYKIPNQTKIKNIIMSEFDLCREQIKNDLKQVRGKIAFTLDLWSNINNEAFMRVTIHFLNIKWKLEHFLLDIIPLNKRHTASNLLNKFTYLLNEFSLNEKIIGLTTDNESAMTVLGRELGEKLIHEFHNNKFGHYRCAAHIINLSVKQGLELIDTSINKVRNLMSKIKNSIVLCDELRSLCDVKNITYLAPEIDVETQWNSTFYMLTKFKKIKTTIKMLIANHDELVEIFPNSDDSQHIDDTLILLDPMEKATKLLSAASYPTMGEMAASIFQKIESYWELIDEKCTISTILDPRYKLSDFEDEKQITAINTIQNVFHTYLQLNHNTTTTTSSISNSQAPQNLHEYFAHLNNHNQNYLLKPLNSELDRYLQLVEDIGIDPLTSHNS
ncbi:21903_t:CDS:2 [Cetraspora pellucida]|uniref:21903_t:CDS:1 n=1 Tax=Cetraspora pellucida TaxID=1433469 RepID=A0A9N8ZJP0_9GLOM|nr:21903_t:CDS:2 [Cetraspora pellucida]